MLLLEPPPLSEPEWRSGEWISNEHNHTTFGYFAHLNGQFFYCGRMRPLAEINAQHEATKVGVMMFWMYTGTVNRESGEWSFRRKLNLLYAARN